MSDDRTLTLEEFLDGRFDLPDAGQWAELEAGQVVLLEPPDLNHGNVILNLSKAIADWTTSHAASEAGAVSPPYACFDLGLILSESPPTVVFPAVSFFRGERFLELDKLATETVPALVIELASTADRRQRLSERIERYFAMGVAAVWAIDPRAETLQVHTPAGAPRGLTGADRLSGGDLLSGFELSVATLFTEPAWWFPRR